MQSDAQRAGMQAADALGEPPDRVLKTLMALVDGKPVCASCLREGSMKRLAAFGGKSPQTMKPADAGRITGYKVGGISPFGADGDRGGGARASVRLHQWGSAGCR